jgi:hypothetical protein
MEKIAEEDEAELRWVLFGSSFISGHRIAFVRSLTFLPFSGTFHHQTGKEDVAKLIKLAWNVNESSYQFAVSLPEGTVQN